MVVDAAQWRKDKAERIARGETKRAVPADIPQPPPPSEVGQYSQVPDEIANVVIDEPPARPAARVHRSRKE